MVEPWRVQWNRDQGVQVHGSLKVFGQMDRMATKAFVMFTFIEKGI